MVFPTEYLVTHRAAVGDLSTVVTVAVLDRGKAEPMRTIGLRNQDLDRLFVNEPGGGKAFGAFACPYPWAPRLVDPRSKYCRRVVTHLARAPLFRRLFLPKEQVLPDFHDIPHWSAVGQSTSLGLCGKFARSRQGLTANLLYLKVRLQYAAYGACQ
ncbi:hypothetical protein [Mycolicibacterium parafortuitum]|uniref:hypothetical protein n=1 Tax=Mycolicibacterium parafortuitum TaxID=39692 RepID=UPI001055B678|nr:hypothetical protein [Mycolicibacterium parafortuitum]